MELDYKHYLRSTIESFQNQINITIADSLLMKISDFHNLETKTKTILEEINEFIPAKNKEDAIESRANHVITSAVNLLAAIKESFDAETSEMLEKRLISSIKSSDPKKFIRTIRKLKEDKDGTI
jgi:predicted transcriptional regulator